MHGERLRELMRGLERLRTERLPTALDPDVETEARGEQVAAVALAMADSAARIPEAADTRGLDAEEQRAYAALADALEEALRRLADQARLEPPGDLEPSRAAVEATCRGCHGRFRIGGLREGF